MQQPIGSARMNAEEVRSVIFVLGTQLDDYRTDLRLHMVDLDVQRWVDEWDRQVEAGEVPGFPSIMRGFLEVREAIMWIVHAYPEETLGRPGIAMLAKMWRLPERKPYGWDDAVHWQHPPSDRQPCSEADILSELHTILHPKRGRRPQA